jgi:hypothetical protein
MKRRLRYVADFWAALGQATACQSFVRWGAGRKNQWQAKKLGAGPTGRPRNSGGEAIQRFPKRIIFQSNYNPSFRLHMYITGELGHLEMTAVDYFVPYYINEQQSEIRGIKRGWYTMDERGKLSSGPFLSPSECLRMVSQPGNASTPVWLH